MPIIPVMRFSYRNNRIPSPRAIHRLLSWARPKWPFSTGLTGQKPLSSRLARYITVSIVLLYTAVYGITAQYKSVRDEPAFELDVPQSWESYRQSDGKTGVFFLYNSYARNDGYIEVRSFTTENDTTYEDMAHQLTARLASRFFFVEMIKESRPEFRNELLTHDWNISEKKKKFRARTAILISGRKVLVLMCMAPPERFSSFRIIFENALLSLNFSSANPSPEVPEE